MQISPKKTSMGFTPTPCPGAGRVRQGEETRPPKDRRHGNADLRKSRKPNKNSPPFQGGVPALGGGGGYEKEVKNGNLF